MLKFKRGDLIKPRPGTGWEQYGVILAEVLGVISKSSPSHYNITVIVSTADARSGFRKGEGGPANEEFFDHV
jgi:hypothetical protein